MKALTILIHVTDETTEVHAENAMYAAIDTLGGRFQPTKVITEGDNEQVSVDLTYWEEFDDSIFNDEPEPTEGTAT